MQIYISKDMFLDAIEEGKFFPKIESAQKLNKLRQTVDLGHQKRQLQVKDKEV